MSNNPLTPERFAMYFVKQMTGKTPTMAQLVDAKLIVAKSGLQCFKKTQLQMALLEIVRADDAMGKRCRRCKAKHRLRMIK